MIATPPDGTGGVDHILAGQLISPGNLCLPCGTAVEPPTFFQKLWPCGPVDGSVHTAASQETGIGCIYNGLHIPDLRDVSPDSPEDLFYLDLMFHTAPPFRLIHFLSFY